MFRKALTCAIAACMMFSMSVPAFAAETDKAPMSEPCDDVSLHDSARVGDMENGITRGREIPDQLYDLEDRSYTVNGRFDSTIYTEYYFYPGDDGDFWYDLYFTWDEQSERGAYVSVQCVDKTTGRTATADDFELEYGETAIATGSWHVYNLNPDHQYYFAFTKSLDGVGVDVHGTIRT